MELRFCWKSWKRAVFRSKNNPIFLGYFLWCFDMFLSFEMILFFWDVVSCGFFFVFQDSFILFDVWYFFILLFILFYSFFFIFNSFLLLYVFFFFCLACKIVPNSMLISGNQKREFFIFSILSKKIFSL
jgi:hypothetical protein